LGTNLAVACSVEAGVWAANDEAAVWVIRCSLLALRLMRELLERLLMQFEFLELHSVPLSTGHCGHTSLAWKITPI